MKIQNMWGIQKMERYLRKNYYSGSIIERANYKRNIIKPRRSHSSIIERNIDMRVDSSLWQRLKRVILK